MLPNKFFGKYDWNINSKTGVGAVWVVAAFVLPMLVWAIFMLACADQGQSDMGVGMAAVFPTLPADCGQMLCLEGLAADCQHRTLSGDLCHSQRACRLVNRIYTQRLAQIGRLKCRASNSKKWHCF